MCPLFCYFCKSLAISCLSTACLKIFSSTRACIDSCKDGGQCKPLQQARTHQEAAIWALHGRGLLCMGFLNALYILIHFLNPFYSEVLFKKLRFCDTHFPVWFSVCKAAPMQCENFSTPPQPLASFSIFSKRFRAGWVNVTTVPILCCELYTEYRSAYL